MSVAVDRGASDKLSQPSLSVSKMGQCNGLHGQLNRHANADNIHLPVLA